MMQRRLGETARQCGWPACLVVAAITVRLIAAFAHSAPLASDPDGYVALAGSLAEGRGFVDPATGEPTAFRPPLYPLLLVVPISLCGPKAGVLLVQLALSGVLVASTWWIGLRTADNGGRWVGGIAAGLVVIDPLLVLYTLQPMTELAFATLVSLLIAALLEVDRAAVKQRSTWGSVLACGGLFGLAALCRPTVWAWAVLMGIAAIVRCVRERGAGYPKRYAVRWWPAWLAAALVVAPWIVRNALVMGRPVTMTTHGGYTLLLANNPVFYDEVVRQPWGTVWEGGSLARWQQSLEDDIRTAEPPVAGELGRDAWMKDRAISNIRSAPRGFLRSCLVRFGRFWNPLPLTGTLPWVVWAGVGLFNGLFLVAAFVGFVRLGKEERRRFQPALLLVLSLSMVHAVYWSNARMRAPVISLLAVLAASSTVRTTNGSTGRNSNP